MATQRITALASMAALLVLAPALSAQPAAVPVQGYLTDSALVPVDASSLGATLRLYSTATGGSPFHTEAATLQVVEGRFVYYVGTATPLNLASFAGGEVYLGVSIGADPELTPRTRVGTTPYAAFAGRVPWSGISGVPASIADGDQDTTYTAAAPLQLNLGTGTFGLSSLGCDDGDAWVWDATSSSWQCEPAAGGGATYDAGAGLQLSGTTFSMVAPTCGAGQYSTWTGALTGWACADDETGLTSLVAGDGIAVLGNEISIAAELCDANEYSRWTGFEWECVADVSSSLTAGAGLQIAGGVVSTVVSGSCDPGRFARWTGLGWVCEADNAGVTGLVAGAGIAVGAGATPSIGTVAPDCTGIGYSMWNGTGWTCVADTSVTRGAGDGLYVDGSGDFAIDGRACGAGQVLSWDGTGWGCADDDAGITSLTAGNGIGVSGSTVSVASPTCGAGQYSSWTGSAWVCVDDVSTGYLAGDGLALSGTTFRVSADTCGGSQYSRWTGSAWTCVTDDAGVTSVTSAGASSGITVAGTLSAPTIAVNSPLCGASEYSRWTAGGWDCVPDVSTAYTAGNGLTLSGTQFRTTAVSCGGDEYAYWTGTQWLCRADLGLRSISGSNGLTTSGSDVRVALSTACAANQYLTWAGTAFACKTDVSSTLTAGDGLQLTGSNQLRVNASACTGTNYLQWSGTAWGCAPDQGFTSLTRGAGVTGTGNNVSLNATVCAGNQYLAWNSTTGFVCKDDVSTTLTAGNGVTINASNQVRTTLSTACQSGSFLTWTGATWGCETDRGIQTLTLAAGGGGLTIAGSGTSAATITTNATACTGANQYSYWTGTAWQCKTDVSTTLGTLATGGVSINASNQIIINSAVCGTGQYSRWLGTGAGGGWTCVADATGVVAANGLITVTPPTAPSTTFTVGLGAPTTCSGGQFLQRSGTTWVCASALSTLTAGSGLNYTSGSLTMPNLAACAAGSFHRWDGTTNGWVCSADTGAVAVAAGNGLTGSYTAATRTVNVAINGTACTNANDASRWNNGAWTCVSTLPTVGGVTGLSLSGRTLSINSVACTGNQVSRWTAAGWTCVDPVAALGSTQWATILANAMVTTGATLTWSAGYRFGWTGGWSGRILVITAGNGSHFSPSGYYEIVQPTTGAVTVVGGAAGRSWDAAGVFIEQHEALYYALPIGGSAASNPANFRIASYGGALEIPSNWILIAHRGENSAASNNAFINLNGGVYIQPGGSYTPSAARPPDTNNFQARLTTGCGANTAIQSIAANGVPTCVAIPQGDITAVNPGNGMTGGGATGDVTLGISPYTYALSTALRPSQDDLSDSSTFGCISTNWVNRTVSTSVVLPIGFSFRFGNTEYTDVRVTSEGVLCFGSGSTCSTSTANNPLPSSSFGSAIFVYWDDMRPTHNNRRENGCYVTQGGSPGKVFIWYQEWEVAATSKVVYSSVMLHEGSDTVSVAYWPLDGGADGRGGTIGYQIGVNGADGVRQISHNVPVLDDNGGESNYWSITPVDTRTR